jgi:hypothetical protein
MSIVVAIKVKLKLNIICSASRTHQSRFPSEKAESSRVFHDGSAKPLRWRTTKTLGSVVGPVNSPRLGCIRCRIALLERPLNKLFKEFRTSQSKRNHPKSSHSPGHIVAGCISSLYKTDAGGDDPGQRNCGPGTRADHAELNNGKLVIRDVQA